MKTARRKMKVERPALQYSHVNCVTGKRAYFNRSGAKVAARLLAKNGKGNLRPYVCWECHEWHIGHNPAWLVRGELAGA